MAIIRVTNELLEYLKADTPEAMTTALLLPWPVVRTERRDWETWLWVDSPDHGPDEHLRLIYCRDEEETWLSHIESVGCEGAA